MPTSIQTFCGRLCGGTCGIRVTVSGGKISDIQGDPECLFNKGNICPKGRALPELIYHPDRLKHPLKRIGKKGEGRWQKITRDEALDAVQKKLDSHIRQFGAESILLYIGAEKGGLDRHFIKRFASVLGTPNIVNVDSVCDAVRQMAAKYTYGQNTIIDFDHPPGCLVVWGRNSAYSESGRVKAKYGSSFEHGTQIIVIDPRRIPLVSRSVEWLKLRPGSDGLLALGMIHVIINENLYDRDFVDYWTIGFNRLREFIDDYAPEKLVEKTWVPEAQIRKAARCFATAGSAAIQWGNALDQTPNAFQTCRAIAILRAITGNLDVPGGEKIPESIPVLNDLDFSLRNEFSSKEKKQIGGRYKLAAEQNFVPFQEASKAILTGSPYPVKAGMIFGSNPLLSHANARKTGEALKKLDFLVVADLFMTPTAAMADIVLPVAAHLEYNDLCIGANYIASRPKLIDPPGDCLSDLQWINLMAQKLGLQNYFWDDEVCAIDEILKPAGLTFSDLKVKRIIWTQHRYRKYRKEGFKTPSGKVELFSRSLADLGIDPLPFYNAPDQSLLTSTHPADEYPLVLTSSKSPFFFHSSYRNIQSLRKRSPEPVVKLNPVTAEKLCLSQGDLVFIETPTGRIKQRLHVNADLDPRVVVVDYGWWFPEQGVSSLFGWQESNLNMLTSSDPPYDPAMGAPSLRGIMCRVYKR